MGEQNFLSNFALEGKIHSTDFIEIWMHYDSDRSGFMEQDEVTAFLTDLFKKKKGAVSNEVVNQAVQQLFMTYDENNDGQLSMNELYCILDVEDSIFGNLSHVDVMGNEEFDTLFNHYDKTGQGFIDSESALFALISDMMRRHGGEISAHELQRVRKAVLAVCDSDGNGRIDKSELQLVLKVASQAVKSSHDGDSHENLAR
ncbi:hypothetical protein ACHWQZ_G017725 [Mnemiopsis leidyi]